MDTTTQSATRRMRLAYVGDAALAGECLGRPGGSIEVIEARPASNGTLDFLPLCAGSPDTPGVDAVLLEHGHAGVDALAILRGLSAKKLHIPVVIVAEWNEDLAVAALTLGASDYVTKSRASFRAVYFRLRRLVAHAALLEERSRLQRNDGVPTDAGRELPDRAQLLQRLSDAEKAREKAEAGLAEAVTAMKQLRQDRLADAVAAAREHAQRESHFADRVRASAAVSTKLEEKLAEREAALTESERQRLGAKAAAQHLAHREATLIADLRSAKAAREKLENQLRNAQTAVRCAEQRVAAEAAAGRQRVAGQQAEFEAELSRQTANREALRQQIVELRLALERASNLASSDASAAAARFAEQETRHEMRVSELVASRDSLERDLVDAEAALQAASERHASDVTELNARILEYQDVARTDAARTAATIAALEGKLAESVAERQRIEARHAGEIADSAERLAASQAASEIWLAEAAAFANALEHEVGDLTAALARVEEQSAADREAAAADAAQKQASFDVQLAAEVAHRHSLLAQLHDLDTALNIARERHASEMGEAAARLAESHAKAEARLAQAEAAIKVAESKRSETAAAMARVIAQATAERQAASEEMRQSQAAFQARLGDEVGRRQAVEQQLAETREAFDAAERQFTQDATAMAERAREREAEIGERAAKEGRRAQQALARAQEQIERLEWTGAQDRTEFERTRAAIEADLSRQQNECAALQQSLEETRANGRATLAQAADERARERDRLESLIADRDARVQDQIAQAQTADVAARAALAAVEDRLHAALEDRRRDADAIALLQDRLAAMSKALETSNNQRDALRTTAERVPALQNEIAAIRAENRRQFDEIPVNRGRCSRTGAITQVNAALAKLLGYATPEELQGIDFPARVLDSADELEWLANQCVALRAAESIETTWRRRDGRRIIVRVRATPINADSIDFVVEDLTPARVIEERLRNAQRMEAVARYGSEVAATCHALLTQVKEGGQQWLTRIESDTVRYHGELLLDDVTRAAGFLGQFIAYGNEQSSVPDLVDVNQVLRDLEPVLKRVAGDDVEVVLPTTAAPLNLDVEARPVERMLVNVAAYGRGRMPRGGRLMIDVASVVLDREFVTKYPNVRPGAHVVLTVNEVRSEVRADASASVRTNGGADNPGVDLGTLQALVSKCGGHLWMKADPPGDMMLKIHLPRRALDRIEPLARPQAVPSHRPRWIHRALGVRH